MSGIGQEALLDVREWSRGPAGCPRQVGRTSRMIGSGREALIEILDFSRDPP